MARPTIPSRVPYQDIEQLQAYMRENLVACDGMPQNADVRAAIIIALTDRIKTLAPNVHRLCLQSIATIANLEAARFIPQDRMDTEIAIEIQKIIAGKGSGVTHYQPLLQQQRAALLDYFAQEKVDKIKNLSARLVQIQERWPRIMEMLTRLRCFCGNYHTDHGEFARLAKRNTVKIRNGTHRPVETLAEIADLTIAHLHALSFQQVRKLLKPS